MALLGEAGSAELVGRSVGSGDDDGAVGNEEGQETLEHDGRAEVRMLNLVEAKQPGVRRGWGGEDGGRSGRGNRKKDMIRICCGPSLINLYNDVHYHWVPFECIFPSAALYSTYL